MKTEFKYITFSLIDKKPKTFVYSCRNNRSGVELGIVKWNSHWRQYCYYSTADAVYSVGCLSDISEFINELKESK